MVLPHVARHLMRTHAFSRIIDAQLILLTLVGACVTLLPLFPGLSFTARFLELWPLGTIFFIPTALWALFLGLPGSQRFLLICIIPPICTAAGLLGLLSGLPADTLSALPLCGVAVSALMLVAAPNPPAASKASEKTKKQNEETIMLDDQLEDPNLRIIALEPPASLRDELPLQDIRSEPLPPLPEPRALPSVLEEALEEPLEALTETAAQLEQCALPTAARSQAKSLVDHARTLVDIVRGVTDSSKQKGDEGRATIDLQLMMRDIYNHALQSGKDTELALGWYMPPELSSFYSGNVQKLKKVLSMLVESAVRATDHGSVHFTVRQYPESTDPGHLLFTITDTGKGAPPKIRSGLALTKAWELAASCDGALTFQSTAQGTTIHLALHLINLEEAEVEPLDPKPLVLICSETADKRHELTRLLSGLDCRTETASSFKEARAKHSKNLASLVIAHDSIASPLAQPIIAQMRREALEHNLPFCKILAITKTDLTWKQLGEAGFTLALLEPLDVEALQTTVQDVIDEYTEKRNSTGAGLSARPVMPDLFGSGENVPKDIEELTNLARLVQTFSTMGSAQKEEKAAEEPPLERLSLGDEDERKIDKHQAESKPSAEAAEQKDNQESKTLDELFPDGLKLTESAEEQPQEEISTGLFHAEDTAAAFETGAGANTEAEQKEVIPTAPKGQQVSENRPNESQRTEAQTIPRETPFAPSFDTPPVPLESTEKSEQNPQPFKTEITPSAEGRAKDPEKESCSEPQVNAHASSEEASQGTWFGPSDWVGEPVPLGSETQKSTQQSPKHASSCKEEPTPCRLEDEWVGERVPVPSSAPTKKAVTQTKGTWFADDEWVGEPFPVSKPQKPQATSEPPAVSKETAKQSFIRSNTWEEGWEEERIPALADADLTEPVTVKVPADTQTSSQDKPVPAVSTPQTPSSVSEEVHGNVLDYIEGTLDTSPKATAQNAETNAPRETNDHLRPVEQKPATKSGESKNAQEETEGIDPALLELVRRLNAAIDDAKKALAASQSMRVAEAAGRIAAECDAFSFRILARVARCVEQAGKAGDLTALKDLLPELAHQVERNNIALTHTH